MRLSAAIGLGFGLLGAIAAANAADCPGNPGAMGTSRVLRIDPREYPLIGTVQYQETLPLNDKEVVLTFDDGPMPPYTNRVLETLAHECVKANFFIVGRMARGYPELLRRIHAEGHVIGTHSENHPLAFEKMPLREVQAEIEQGFASTCGALRNPEAVAPFFRIPGLLRAENVEQYLRSRGMVTWSADVVADDWKHISASEVVSRSIARLDARGKGILLLHDIQPATALALPHLLRELKRRGYKIVQVVPAAAPALVAGAPRPPQPAAATVTTIATTTAVAKPQRETSSWPVPFAAATTAAHAPAANAPQAVAPQAVAPPQAEARPEPLATATVSRAVPVPAQIQAQIQAQTQVQQVQAQAPAPIEIPPEAALANASPAPTLPPAEPAPPLPARTMPVPILESVRSVPAKTDGRPDAQPAVQQATRPLTPGFKPSHSDAPSMKVSEMPVERQPADPWAMRAEVRLPPR